jgi:chromosome segregation ATPase
MGAVEEFKKLKDEIQRVSNHRTQLETKVEMMVKDIDESKKRLRDLGLSVNSREEAQKALAEIEQKFKKAESSINTLLMKVNSIGKSA